MNREILFRGKNSRGEWVYGDLHIVTTDKPHIHSTEKIISKSGGGINCL